MFVHFTVLIGIHIHVDVDIVYTWYNSNGDVLSALSHTALPAVLPSLSPVSVVTNGTVKPTQSKWITMYNVNFQSLCSDSMTEYTM